MSPTELLTAIRHAGIDLQADGDRLVYDAPKGMMTAELRIAIVEQKAALLAILARPRAFVTLVSGLILPIEAIELALDLEARGFKMSLDTCDQFQIEPSNALTAADLAAIQRWRLHLASIISYNADAHEATQ
jgi:TubC N-terminal docking domain